MHYISSNRYFIDPTVGRMYIVDYDINYINLAYTLK